MSAALTPNHMENYRRSIAAEEERHMSPTQQLRLECLQLAISISPAIQPLEAKDIADVAGVFYDFIIGTDRATLAVEAKAAIDRMAG